MGLQEVKQNGATRGPNMQKFRQLEKDAMARILEQIAVNGAEWRKRIQSIKSKHLM